MAQLMPLPLTVSFFSKIQIGFTFLVPAHPGSPGQRAVKLLCLKCLLPSVLTLLVGHQKEHPACKNLICMERGANCMHMVQLMPVPSKTPSSLALFKIPTGFTFLVPAYPGCPRKEANKWV